MNQFFFIRKSKNDPKTGTIYKAVYDDRTPISRDSLKIKIPIKYWDDKRQQVRVSMEIDHEKYNFILNQHKSDFLGANKKAVRTNRDCFIEFALDYLEKNYTNEGTKIKYTTILKSLKKYVNEELGLNTLSFEELRKIDFIKGYKKWVFKRQYKSRDKSVSKRTKTVFNYLITIQTFVKRYNELNPEKEEIKTLLILGDTFDRRKYVNFFSLKRSKEMFFNPLAEMDIKVHMLAGNHDTYFKNTNNVNSVDLLLGEYPNINIIDSPQTIHLNYCFITSIIL